MWLELDSRGRKVTFGVVLALVTLVIYWPATGFDFTNFDDPDYVTENPVVRQGLTWSGVWWALTSTSSAMWLPLTRLGHLVNWELFGAAAGGHHFVNIFFHSINAVLAYGLFLRMTGAVERSAMVAALFAWHPLRVESVAWVAEFKDVLAMFFWLVAALVYVRAVRSGRRRDWWVLAVVYGLGLMAKPMLVTFPFAMLLLDVWPLRRLTLPGGDEVPPPTESGPRISWWVAIREKLPLMAMGAAVSALTLLTSKELTEAAQIPLANRVSNALVAYVRYLQMTVYPLDLAALYPHPGTLPSWQTVLAGVLLSALTLLALKVGRRQPFAFTGWFWYVGTLVPVIGIVQAGPQALADRFTYAPSLGLAVLAVWGMASAARHLPFGYSGAAGLGVAVLVACLALTRVQLGYWQNSITLFERALAVTSGNEIAQHNLGQALASDRRFAEAVPHYEEAIRLDPRFEEAWLNLGVARATLGALSNAVACFQAVIGINPTNGAAHYNLGLSRFLAGQMEMASAGFSEALRCDPAHGLARLSRARASLALGRLEAARQDLRQQLALTPLSAETHSELGALELQAGQPVPAAEHLREALRLEPGRPGVYGKLGSALSLMGEPAEAASAWTKALVVEPNSIDILNSLAWLRATETAAAHRDGAEAVRLAEHACNLTSNQVPEMIGTLAAAYAEAGQFDLAGEKARQAATLADRTGQTNVAARSRELERMFEQRKTYRSP